MKTICKPTKETLECNLCDCIVTMRTKDWKRVETDEYIERIKWWDAESYGPKISEKTYKTYTIPCPYCSQPLLIKKERVK